MDDAERDRRRLAARDRVENLRAQGVVAVAASFTDNAGISRAKSVPLDRFPHLAAWGVGATPCFDLFGFDDQIAVSADGTTPIGDLRVIPDLDRVTTLSADPGWAWAPASRYAQDGTPHPGCSRSRLAALMANLDDRGLSMRSAFEIEWVLSAAEGDEFAAATSGPGYGLARLTEVSAYARDLLEALDAQGVVVEQFHPEYAPGQFELSVAPEDPVAAADTSVLVRETIRSVGRRHGLRTSFSPKVDLAGVGNGGHVHASLQSGGDNQMSGGDGAPGMTPVGEAFTAGVLRRLPALMALGAPGLASYLRMVPSHWAGVYRCWGIENREAAVRVVTGSTGQPDAANVEVKCFDLLANPYLVLAGLVAAGSDGMDASARLPGEVTVDPAALSDEQRQARGVEALPTSLAQAVAEFEHDDVLRTALGDGLHASILAVRRMEMDMYASATPEEIAAAARWRH